MGPPSTQGLGSKQVWKYPKGDVRGHACPSMGWFVCSHTGEKASAWKSHFNTPTVWVFNSNPVPNMHLLFLLFFGYHFLLLRPLSPCEAFFRWKCSGRSSWCSLVPKMSAWPWAALPAITPSPPALPTGSAWPLAALREPKPSRSLLQDEPRA